MTFVADSSLMVKLLFRDRRRKLRQDFKRELATVSGAESEIIRQRFRSKYRELDEEYRVAVKSLPNDSFRL